MIKDPIQCICSICHELFIRARTHSGKQKDRCVYCRDLWPRNLKPIQARAWYIMRDAILLGKLPKLGRTITTDIKCVDCGEMAVCYDHRDYTKPLDVEPCCNPCNRKRGPAFPYNSELDLCLDDYR